MQLQGLGHDHYAEANQYSRSPGQEPSGMPPAESSGPPSIKMPNMPQNIGGGAQAEAVARFVAKDAGNEAESSPRPGEETTP